MKRVYALCTAALMPLAASADPHDDALEMLGWTHEAVLAQVISDMAGSFVQRGMTCGRAMTDRACDATNANFMNSIAADPMLIRERMLDRLVPKGREEVGLTRLEQELVDVPVSSFDVPLCSGTPIDRRCSLILDLMMFGGVVQPTLDAARAKAATEVDPFYTDGRPFDG